MTGRNGTARWAPGTVIAYRSMAMGRLMAEVEVTVVRDDPDVLALYRPYLTPLRRLVPSNGASLPRVLRPDAFAALPDRYESERWPYGHALLLTPVGAEYSVYLNWSPGWTFERWYVNFERPLVRVDGGVEVTDEFLDLIVHPDGEWEWKDEDELDEAVAVGRLDAVRADRVRATARRVVGDVEARRWPFDGSWAEWRPGQAPDS